MAQVLTDLAERRQYPRVELDVTAELKAEGSGSSSLHIVDISASGMGVVLEHEAADVQLASVHIEFPAEYGGHILDAQIRRIWSRPGSKGAYLAGFTFIGLGKSDRLFLEQLTEAAREDAVDAVKLLTSVGYREY